MDFDYPLPSFNRHDWALRSTTTKKIRFEFFCSSKNKPANADTNSLFGNHSAPIAKETSPRDAHEGLSINLLQSRSPTGIRALVSPISARVTEMGGRPMAETVQVVQARYRSYLLFPDQIFPDQIPATS
jgi:hypothetical protein